MMKMSDAPPPCPSCGAAVDKQISVSSFHLKGGGWYSDHYGLKSGGEGGGSGGGE
jgi:predicted nucleic acid-binding Zn ribbon protein